MLTRYTMFAGYNAWCNERLYDATARVDDGDYRADRGAFFKSLHGTLNHLLLGDRIWMTRFEGGSHPSTNLDAILFDDFVALRGALADMDRRIEDFFSSLPADFPGRSIRYVNNAGVDSDDPVDVLLPHFFNHQTHHRAQVHTLLSQLGRAPPSLDLHRALRP